MEKEFHKLYYSPEGYQRGTSAAKKLKDKLLEIDTKATIPEIQKWLNKQPIYQLYKAKPKVIKFPHYTQDKPNHTHQIDLLFLPHDMKYKYALTVIDIASRYKEAEPLKTKTAREVSKAIEAIYQRSPLKFPANIMCDKGHEFMGEFIQLMKKHDTKIHRSLDKKKVAFVERFNKTLSEKIFAHQYANEIEDKEVSREWVKRLPAVIEAINNEVTRMIDMKPIDAIKLESVKQPAYDKDFAEEDIPIDSRVRYLYKPGEAENDNRYRATDPIWSIDVYGIDEIRPFENQPSLYTLQDLDEERTFTKQQLQVVPGDTED